jgi:hypothetical protein
VSTAADAYRSQYDLAFQVSPIILQGGIAKSGLIPIIQLYGQTGLLTPSASVNDFFAQYLPLPGSTLISNAVGMYPFANQTIAANAVIQQPLTLSMLMIAPVNQPGGYLTKLSTFTALQGSLQLHNASGGTYVVATPAFVFTNLIMTGMTDTTHGEGNQQQIEWQLDFIAPLLTLAAAAAAQNNLMATITGGGQIVGTPAWTPGQQQALSPGLPAILAALAAFGAKLGSAA